MYDIAIVGGGLVGASLACTLARQTHYKILLIEANPPKANDTRLFALNIQSEQFLEKIKLWADVKPHASLIQAVHVSREGHFGLVRFRPEEIELTHLGHVVPAARLEEQLHFALRAETTIDVFQPAHVKQIKQEQDAVVLMIEREGRSEIHQAKIVVAADGAFSLIRDQLHIECERCDYEETAIVSRTRFSESSMIAEQRLLKDNGTLAVLPLLDNERAVILSVDHKRAEELLSLSDESYVQFLNQHFSGRQGRCEGVHSRHHFPLKLMRAKQTVLDRVALLGNATYLMHPIAAQGFNLALREVGLLSTMLLEHGCTREALQQFSTQCQRIQKNSIGLSHWLSRAANSATSPLLDWPLQSAFFVLMNSRFLRRQFLRRLLGQE